MKRTLLLTALLFCPVTLHAQHLVDDVDLPDVIHITDNSIPGFTPVAMTWKPARARWSGTAVVGGQSLTYHLHRWDDENGEQYVVGVDYPGIGLLDAASRIVSRRGVKPLVFYKKFSDFPISYYWALILGDAFLPIQPLPPSTYAVQ